jgi:hypothetical protein
MGWCGVVNDRTRWGEEEWSGGIVAWYEPIARLDVSGMMGYRWRLRRGEGGRRGGIILECC